MYREHVLFGMHRQHLKIGVCILILDVTKQKVNIILNAAVWLVVPMLQQREKELIRQLEIWRGRDI